MPNPLTAPFGEMQITGKSLLTHISFHYNINPEIVTAAGANGGTVEQAASAALLKTGTNPNGSALIRSRLPARYISGQGLQAIFSAQFGEPQPGNIQEAGYGNTEDGFFFEYNGETFGINRRSSASGLPGQTGEIVNHRKPLAQWSQNRNFEFNPLLFNIYAITFQWLGAGEIVFHVESPHSGVLVPVHEIKYANSAQIASILNPSLPLWARTLNNGNIIDTTLKIGNAAAYAFGAREVVGPRHAARAALAYTLGAERLILAIENMTDVFGGAGNNRSTLQADKFGYSTEGAKPVTFRVYRCTISGGANAAIDANTSIAKQYTGTPTLSNPKFWYAIEAAKADHDFITLPDAAIPPGEAIAVTVESVTNSDVTASLSWKEFI
jgi:hypothetical protein